MLTKLESFAYQGQRPNPGLVDALATLPEMNRLILSCLCFSPKELRAFATHKKLKVLRLMKLGGGVVEVIKHLPEAPQLISARDSRN